MIPPKQVGRYRLLQRLGVGGMAEVFEATTDGAGEQRVALKILLPDCQREPELVRSFVDEARIAAELHHPNIVAVYDAGEAAGTNFMAMELVDGWDLRELLRRAAQRQRRLPVAAAAFIIHEVALALHHVHTRQRTIVHRDVSPHNVFLTRAGEVKLGDFGVAKTSARLARTVSGQIKGKLAYLAPEQVSGDPVTGRTDVYAAGLVLYELLTGRRYIEGESEVELLRAAQSPRACSPSSIAPDAAPLDTVVQAALELHPAMRTRDAALLAEQLQGFLGSGGPFGAEELAQLLRDLDEGAGPRAALETAAAAAPARNTVELSPAPSRRARGTWWIAGGAALALSLGVVSVVSFVRSLRDTPEHAALAPHVDARVAVAIRDATPTVAAPAPDLTVAGDRQRIRGKARRARHGTRRAASPSPRPETKRDPNVAKTPTPDATERQRGGRRLQELTQRAGARGLFAGDDAAYDGARARSKSAVGRGEGMDAALRDLEAVIDRFRIDQTFIRRKLKRLEAVIDRPSLAEAERQRLTLVSQRILKLVLGGQLLEASRQISAHLGAR